MNKGNSQSIQNIWLRVNHLANRGQLTSRIALHYLLPELIKVETEAILRHALGAEAPDEMIEQIHQVPPLQLICILTFAGSEQIGTVQSLGSQKPSFTSIDF
jgi:hypothetical protein